MTTPAPPPTGLIAILRGLTPDEAPAAGAALRDAGIRILEVPLNSPEPYRSIRLLRDTVSPRCLVGAGTVLTAAEVRTARAAGAELIVSPNTNAAVVTETVRLRMRSFPGAATPSEALSAIAAGARAVKVFPAAQVSPAGLKAWTAVLPAGFELIPVGGISGPDFPSWAAAGATGFGIGSALYTPGTPVPVLITRARALLSAWQSASEQITPRSSR
jgi:2-dehydro-3-deoxyphosphogalactonate aldolase